MWIRLFFRRALLGLLLILPAVAPAAAQSGRPAAVLILAPYDQLRSDFLYLAKLAGQDKYAALIEQTDEQTGNGGQRGIDRKKPMGGYGWVGPQGDDSIFVLLIPVTDQAAFIDLLGIFDIRFTKGDDGVYSANLEKSPDPVYLRFANGYAYITRRDKRVLADDRLLAPGDVVAGPGCGDTTGQLCWNGSEALLTLNVDRIPDAFKDRLVAQVEQGQEAALFGNAPERETEMQRKYRLMFLDAFAKKLKTDFSEGGEISERLDFDRAAGEIALTMRSTAKPGTAMAARVQELAQVRSITAGLIKKDAVASGTAYVSGPEFHGLFGSKLDDLRAEALVKAKDDSERSALNTAFDAFAPTLKSAEFDGTFNLQGPDGNGFCTLVGGVSLKDGAKVEQAFRRWVPKEPAVTEVRFDVDRVGPVGIHRLFVAKMDNDGHRHIFGDNTVHVAFRDDAVFFAMGSGGLSAIKDALAVAPSTGKVMDLQIIASRLAPLTAEPMFLEVARKVFADKKDGNDRFRLTLEGGDASTLRLTAGAKFVEYASQFMSAAFKLRPAAAVCDPPGVTGPGGDCVLPPVLPVEK
jgi:hypothetical protein